MKELLMGFGKNCLAKYYCKIISLQSLKKKRTVCSTRKFMLSTEHVSRTLLTFTVILVPTKHQTLPQTCSKSSCSQFQCYLNPKIRISTFHCDALLMVGKHCNPVDIWLLRDGMVLPPEQGCALRRKHYSVKQLGFLCPFNRVNGN